MPQYEQLTNLNGNMLAALDVETTGLVPGFHEIVQIAIVPMGADLKPLPIRPFYHVLKPQHKERAEKESMSISGLSLEELEASAPEAFTVADWLEEWVRDLELPFQRSLVPLAHNWAFEKGFLTDWLGFSSVGKFFFSHPRDTMTTALYINDCAAIRGEPVPFPTVNLPDLCKFLGIEHTKAHDAYADSLACAEAYRRLTFGYGVKGLAGAGSSGNPAA